MKRGRKGIPMREDYFQTWSPAMAYILGIIVSDGCVVNKNSNYQCIVISVDKPLLDFIQTETEYSHPIRQQSDGCYRLSLTRKEVVLDLMALGILPRKTWNPLLPPVPDEYFKYFALGYFDGDGHVSVYTREKNPNYWIIQSGFTCASKPFLQEFGNRLKEQTGLIPKIHKAKDAEHKYKMEAAIYETILLYHYFYDNPPPFYLQRKKDKFDFWLEKQNDPNWGMTSCKFCGHRFVRTHDRSKRCWKCKKQGKHIGSRDSPALVAI